MPVNNGTLYVPHHWENKNLYYYYYYYIIDSKMTQGNAFIYSLKGRDSARDIIVDSAGVWCDEREIWNSTYEHDMNLSFFALQHPHFL